MDELLAAVVEKQQQQQLSSTGFEPTTHVVAHLTGARASGHHATKPRQVSAQLGLW